MKQKKMILGVGAFLASLAFGGMITSCTSESLLQEPAATYEVPGKVPVVLDIKGLGGSATRAGARQAAFDYEKEIRHLYAVVFHDGGTLYKVIEVTIPAASENKLPYFDLGKTGDYRIFFVANPGANLKTQIDALKVGESTATDFANLKQTVADTYRVGNGRKNGVSDGFLMVENNSAGKKVTPLTDEVTPVSITLERAAARFDIVNNVPGLAVTSVKFDNYPASTYLLKPTAQDDGTVVALSTDEFGLSEYGDPGLLGNTIAPGTDGDGYVGDLYCYEWMRGYSGDKPPMITLKYKEQISSEDWNEAENGEITVSFIVFTKDAEGNFRLWTDLTTDEKKKPYIDLANKLAPGTSPDILWRGLVPRLNDEKTALEYIPIERNHLYRIRVVLTGELNYPVVSAVIEVADWNEGTMLGGIM